MLRMATLTETAMPASNKLRPRRQQLGIKMATTLMGMTLDRHQDRMEMKMLTLPPQLKSIRESEWKGMEFWNERGQLSGRLTQSSSWEATAQKTPMRRNEN